MNEQYCKLCKKQTKLCESHIVSKLAYKDIKNIDQKIINVNALLENFKETQDGPKEYLFCKTCEDMRGKTETYFSNLIQHDRFFRPNFTKYSIKSLDYDKMKLFVMWTLYAYFVSSLCSKCDQFNSYLDDLADMLTNNDPGGISEYGFTLKYLINNRNNPKTIVVLPQINKIDNQLIADMIIKGLYFRILLNGNADDKLSNDFLQIDGSIKIEKTTLRSAIRKIGYPV